ncbi:DUF1361 domain-containing protein [Cognaticolwellia mytili]|uniref:DUF1361 domain-containing protein n=1 Tax=Cognaticolwellia mytili TaxID=1888913 RepID=UPI000A16D54F|nr:DUF1361 domain-containing protein [Cognaticolwellia mytili]
MNSIPVHFTVVINFILAFIPFVLAFYLFKVSHHRSVLWWILSLVFVAFIPNSAYVLTDIIHFIAAVKSPNISTAYLLLVLVPFYIIFLLVNFEFYVISIQWADQYLKHLNQGFLSKAFVPIIHLLAAIGVYLGRFQRLESSDIIHHPIIVFRDVLVDISGGKSMLIIIALFLLFYSFYEAFSRVNNVIKAKVKARIATHPMKAVTI